ncbi:hypothetical protein [Agriterribacter humi]|jgi:hypothetical protein|uniref:hypothetical protein n=1 Tax=Agriterribacter humi TaxID=1104781 RepID=UPI001263EB73|nr:hypothetical protein [Agriterribacter humi]
MKFSPQVIIYVAVKNYLTEDQAEVLKNELAKKKVMGDKIFMDTIKKHFDIEFFRTKPFIWQDIWLYNYLIYELRNTKMPKRGLIAKYEKEIIIPQEEVLEEARELVVKLN